MNLGKKKRSGNLAMTAIAVTAVLTAVLGPQAQSIYWAVRPPTVSRVLAAFRSQPRVGEAMLARLPQRLVSVRLLMELLSEADPRAARAAQRTILRQLDTQLTNHPRARHDTWTVWIAAELETRAREARLPLGITDELVGRLLRGPMADVTQRALVATHCARALQITAEKQGTRR